MDAFLTRLVIVCFAAIFSAAFAMNGIAQISDPGPSSEFSKLIVFGDSLSDTGNIAVVDLPPPYFNNRISNGPVLADFLAQLIGSNAESSRHLLGAQAGFNYAVAGGNVVGDDLEDIGNQVDSYLTRVAGQADPDALYFIFAGGNDLRGIRGIRVPAFAEAEIQAVIDELEDQITRLKQAGARAFVVPNLPNVGRIPETLDEQKNDPDIASRATLYTLDYNNRLNERIASLAQDQSIRIRLVDVFSNFEFLLDNPAQFGFNNTRQGCFDVERLIVELDCILFGFDQRVFFDNVHPSAATNANLAELIFTELPSLPSDAQNRVVLPAIIDLLL